MSDITQPRRLLRSTGAVVAGLLTIIVTSLVVDQVLHALGVYPPWGEPMHDPGLNLVALSYRIVFAVLGGYVAARLAPHRPMRHALILGCIGVVLAILGSMGALASDMSPAWFLVALVLTALPCAWAGGLLHQRWHGRG